MTESNTILTCNLDTRASHVPHMVSADLGGETALLDPERGLYYKLNEVGARIWELLGQSLPAGEIREILLREFDVESEQCEQELFLLLSNLHAFRLVTFEEKDHA
jgi:hypothetical protein